MKIIYCPNAGGGCEKNGLGTERIPLSFFLLFIGEAEVGKNISVSMQIMRSLGFGASVVHK